MHLQLSSSHALNLGWQAKVEHCSFEERDIAQSLMNLEQACYVVIDDKQQLGVAKHVEMMDGTRDAYAVVAFAQPLPPINLGAADFKMQYGVKYAYHVGAMANGIASEELVIACGKRGILASFGAAGLVPARVEQAIQRIQSELPNGPYAFNLIHSPKEEALERGAVECYLQHGVHTVEASAYMSLTEHIVRYRVSGLSANADGTVGIANKVIAKVSRKEVALHFMRPAPEKMLQHLLAKGHISEEQMQLARRVPMADDITAEADSGGHTDNRALVALLPSIIALRDQVQSQYGYAKRIRVGAGGGIGTPQAALAAFNMGAAYIVTGSINQSCIEAGASEHTRKLLSQAEVTDVTMAPAADMFELGVKLQVLKRGSLFAMRAQKLYELYTRYASIEDIPQQEREKIETQIFRQNLDDVWSGTKQFFEERDPEVLAKALQDSKRKMALIFRWYLGLSSRWSNIGEQGREMDYQIWAGPALGAFNEWVGDSYLADYAQRQVADIARHLLTASAYQQRINLLKLQGLSIDTHVAKYTIQPFA